MISVHLADTTTAFESGENGVIFHNFKTFSFLSFKYGRIINNTVSVAYEIDKISIVNLEGFQIKIEYFQHFMRTSRCHPVHLHDSIVNCIASLSQDLIE